LFVAQKDLPTLADGGYEGTVDRRGHPIKQPAAAQDLAADIRT
jgi:hypothetical protein